MTAGLLSVKIRVDAARREIHPRDQLAFSQAVRYRGHTLRCPGRRHIGIYFLAATRQQCAAAWINSAGHQSRREPHIRPYSPAPDGC